MSEWRECKLTELGTLARGKSKHRPRWASHLYGGEYPFVQTGKITAADKYIVDYEDTYSEAGLAQSKLWPKNTLCITIAANIAEIAILKIPMCFPDSVLGFIPDKEKCDLDFIFYTLKHFRTRIRNLAIGSVQDNINLGTFNLIKFKVPDITEQRRIATILSTLDTKIDLLQRQNHTLEQIAQTLFKRWFVKFEFPVTAVNSGEGIVNSEERIVKSEERIVKSEEFFTNHHSLSTGYKSSGGPMVASELGEIPEGWRVGSFLDIFDLLSGGTPKTSMPEYWDGKIKWLSGKDVTSNHRKFILNTEKQITEDGLNNSATKLLPKFTTVISARGTVGCYCLLSEPMCMSQTSYGIKAKSEDINFSTYLSVSHIVEMLKSQAYGSVFDTITTNTFKQAEFVIPPQGIQLQFETLVNPIFYKILTNETQIQTLTRLRDTLLPKLMSGKLRVKGSE